MSERARMLAGDPYDANDPELVGLRQAAEARCQALASSSPFDEAARRAILVALFGRGGETVGVHPPFWCDYGVHIELGDRVFFNVNCVVLDVCPVRIGSGTMFGPGVQILTATHPLDAIERRGRESGRPITIGDDVWVGGGAIILPGVTVGARSVVGAGSVVTRDVPDDVVVAGNPCRVIRRLWPGTA
ncbi:maltose O-acetyltransferase [Luteitalea sp. TBR-22]|uniref:sugar O-acetyltransferase n=1 Tax=Luteitalea sp. TBR-22 TaxID=2802971 RepID=UPI001AF3C7BA|nr:sugar O-acetyltransferase [Luteitalea sp. TBR-22]BCS32422.1 maltose O-acetyltransferase [Luteitalea sp. TBR-22]